MTSAPLIITRDDMLLDELLRLGAAAGVVPEVSHEPGAALRGWAAAPLVLVGADLAGEMATVCPPRRPRVHVVALGSVGDHLFRQALALGAENVAELPRSETWVLETLTDLGDGAIGRGVTVGVVGGSGGSGATTFACALALVAARHGPALLVDADPLGPGVDRVLGFEGLDGVRWGALQQTTGRLSARALREALPHRDGLGALTWSPGPQGTLQAFAVREALSAGCRGHDVVVVDLPRTVDPVVEEVTSRCDHVVLTSLLSVSALASTTRTAARLSAQGTGIWLVTRGAAAGVGPREASRVVGVPLAASMGDQRGLDEAVDLGLGPLRSRRGALARAAAEVLDRLRAAAVGPGEAA